MAVVNRFNVNKQQVTLDADIIENMSANDVSYDNSIQYDENTVGDKLLELEGKTIKLDVEINGKTDEKYVALNSISGKYYAINAVDSKITLKNHEDFSYCEPIDVSNYIGKQIIIKRSGEDLSGAICAFGDANDMVIKRIVHSIDFIIQPDDSYLYDGVIPENSKTLYLSSRTSILISVDIKGDVYNGLCDDVSALYVATSDNTSRIEALEKSVLKIPRFPDLPYKVLKSIDGYCVENIYSKKSVDTKIYVHSTNGLDTNNGSETTPLKTLKGAINKFNTLGKSAEIVIIDNATFYTDDLYGEIGYQYSLIINAPLGANIINGVKTTYTKKDGYSNVYECLQTGKNIVGCVYASKDNIDSFGLYKALKSVTSIALVDSTTNSYFIENGIAYVNIDNSANINDVIPIVSGYGLRFTCLNRRDCFLYLKGLNVIGANYNNARSEKFEDGHTLEYIIEDCAFQHSMMNDMIPSNNFDVMYFVNVVAGYSKQDVFNHHANTMTDNQITKAVVVCVNCLSEYAGIYGLYGVSGEPFINNIYTAHEGMNVLRVNCRGQHSEGPLFADVNGCRSVNINCEALNTFFSSNNVNINGCYVFNSTDTKKSDITLLNCNGFDVRTDNLAFSDSTLDGAEINWSRVSCKNVSLTTIIK